jgi:DNA-binding NarL/FixJ family response regulator
MTTGSGGAILVVDDDGGFARFLSGLLQSLGYRTTELANGADVLPTAAAERPALVILDVHLPDLNGYEVCRELRERYGDSIGILFVSGERTDPMDRTAGLLLGANDYMLKPVDPSELIARVRRLAGAPEANGDNGASTERLSSLTEREREVLDLLADGQTQDEIARTLVISPKTVATHIQRILGKLGVRSRAQAVSIALRREDVTGGVVRY